MSDYLDRFMDWSMAWIIGPFLVVSIIALGVGMVGGVGWVSYWALKQTGVITENKEDISISIQPFYWSCTSAYLAHHSGYTGGGKIRRKYYDYYHCHCNQWTAHMVGVPHGTDAVCSNGDRPYELAKVR